MSTLLMTELQVPGVEWRVPDPLVTESPPKAYPTESLPPVMRDAVYAMVEHVMAPAVLAGQCAIAAVAYLAQTRVNAPHLHNQEGMPCTLFQLALADSGDRKSECYRLAFKTIEEAERATRDGYAATVSEIRRMQAGLSGKALQAFKEEMQLPSDPRSLYTDVTFERIAGDFINGMPSAMWATDEGGRILGGHSMKSDTIAATLGGLVKLFDCGKAERDRVGEFGNGVAYDRRFSMHMLAQEITVRQALNDPLLQGQGFLPRFLMAAAPSLAGTRLLTPEKLKISAYKTPALQRYWARCKEIARMQAHVGPDNTVKPPVMVLSPEAELVWLEFYNRIEADQGSLGEYGGPLKPFASRSGELSRRLAAVFALFEGEDEISRKTMIAACEVVEHSLGEWARYLGASATESNGKHDALELLGWLKEYPDVRTVTDILKGGPRKYRSASKARNTLATLTAAGWVVFPTSNKKNFEVNPHELLAETANPANPEKTQVTARAQRGESEANLGELANAAAHAERDVEKIRLDSPAIRHDEFEYGGQFSPDSPNSPLLVPAEPATTGQWSMEI
ncbi:DUF3987 domain-containing protein [Pseudomonas sp. MAP12]|uniref:DUF3987 domain-containing protein n=1 Tax=Geopseudomonas aromaticivorans TaxID=2849492 RepID=A0ABS6MY88_9GAMM|nr:DUF3987 domain-containing protein [Pseudomonas aromaticivorans]MBV2133354.1 DUF3987 domain-containing protein [Pseudomonas aromaticivorans]